MNRQKIAQELVRMAEELTARERTADEVAAMLSVLEDNIDKLTDVQGDVRDALVDTGLIDVIKHNRNYQRYHKAIDEAWNSLMGLMRDVKKL